MIITSQSVSLTAEEAFDYICQRNKRLWAEAVDLIEEYAKELYYDNPCSSNKEDPFADGISLDSSVHSIHFKQLG
jgi:hypothetical protein